MKEYLSDEKLFPFNSIVVILGVGLYDALFRTE